MIDSAPRYKALRCGAKPEQQGNKLKQCNFTQASEQTY